jgi:hypothetical protein
MKQFKTWWLSYLSQHGQYSLAWYYASLAAKIPKPAVSEALFISYDIYNFWGENELASLRRHIFLAEPAMGMQAAVTFWNNGYAPDSLRWSFSSIMKSYVRPIGVSVSDVYRFTGEAESVPLALFKSRGVVHLVTPQSPARAESIMQPFTIVEMDIQSQLVRDLGVVKWSKDAFFEHVSCGSLWGQENSSGFLPLDLNFTMANRQDTMITLSHAHAAASCRVWRFPITTVLGTGEQRGDHILHLELVPCY